MSLATYLLLLVLLTAYTMELDIDADHKASVQEFIPDIVTQMLLYSNASALYVLSDDFDENAMVKVALKTSTWFKKIIISPSYGLQALFEGFDKPRLVLLPLNENSSIALLSKALHDVELLNSATWLMFGPIESLHLEFKTSPLLRLFIVNLHFQKQHVGGHQKTVVGIAFWHWDYMERQAIAEPAGYWSCQAGLHMEMKFKQCCYNLTGMTVKMVHIPNTEPYTGLKHSKGTLKLTGIFGEIFSVISKHIGIRYEIYTQNDGIYGDYPGPYGNGSGAIKDLLLKKVDMIYGALLMTSGRHKVVDFSYPVMETAFTVLYKDNNQEMFYSFFLAPFSTDSWILVALATACCVLLVFLSCCLMRQQSGNFDHVMQYWASIFSQGIEIQPNTSCGKLLLHFCFMLLGLLLSMFYASTLISQSAVKLNKAPFTTLGELALNKRYRPLIRGGSAQINILQNSQDTEYVQLWKRIGQNLADHSISEETKLLATLDEGDSAYFGDVYSLNIYRAHDSSLRVIPAQYMKSGLYLVFQKNSHLLRIFNDKINSMRETGVIDRIIKSEVKITHKLLRSSPQPVSGITLHQTSLAFLILAITTTLSLIILRIEKLIPPKL